LRIHFELTVQINYSALYWWAFNKKENWFIPEKLERVLNQKMQEDLMKKFKPLVHKIRSFTSIPDINKPSRSGPIRQEPGRSAKPK